MDKIFDEFFFKIYHWALKKTNNKEDAEDLTNDIFVAVFEYFDEKIDIRKLENLIWKIARNIWSTRAKKYIKEKNDISYDEILEIGKEEKILDKIIYREIVENLEDVGLTEKESSSFRLYYIEDLSIKEISLKLYASEGNIKYYLYNARRKIKERYGNE